VVDKVQGNNVMDENFNTKTGCISSKQNPHTVVTCGMHQDCKAAFFIATNRNTFSTEFFKIALWTVLGEFPVQYTDNDHQNTGNQKRNSPSHCLFYTEHHQSSQH